MACKAAQKLAQMLIAAMDTMDATVPIPARLFMSKLAVSLAPLISM
jgi:hypothetical protein